jgi:hypothetical protein
MKLTDLPDHSRVWIYQADRFLTADEVSAANLLLKEFTSKWAAHGVKLNASAEIIDQLFVVIGVDEKQAAASGCSIDASMSVILQLESQFNVSFTNRMMMAAEVNNAIALKSIQDLPELIDNKEITLDTLVYDNLVNTIGDWKTNWKKPIRESWHVRFV